MKEDKVGEININTFGSKMIIAKYRKYNDIDVYFPEYDWTYYHTRYEHFKNGRIKCPYESRYYDKGYIGDGKYALSMNGIDTKVARIWSHMLERCYSNNLHKKYPTYKDCEVCDEWLNFQNFAEWCEKNYYEIEGERMDLDKDILSKNNKIYSPDTCIFVPSKINSVFAKKNWKTRGDLPTGVSICKNKKQKYHSQCRIGSCTKHLGYYDTPEEAFMAYKTFKENYIKQIADRYKEYMPEKLYNALYEYEIEYED